MKTASSSFLFRLLKVSSMLLGWFFLVFFTGCSQPQPHAQHSEDFTQRGPAIEDTSARIIIENQAHKEEGEERAAQM